MFSSETAIKIALAGPCGLLIVLSILLSAAEVIGALSLATLLAWNVIISGCGYAGRLPIHLCGGRYISRQRLHDPELRPAQRKLNICVTLNALSILAWFGLGAYLLGNPEASLELKAVLCVVFYVPAFWLNLETVRCTVALGLPRGTEIVCRSRLGRWIVLRDANVPRGNPFSLFFAWLKKVTPRHQMSAFAMLALSCFLALPAAGFAANEIGPIVREEIRGESHPDDGSGDSTGGPLLYDDLCTGRPEPGKPAPSPYQEGLRALWLGAPGIDGAGAIQGGCARPARRVSGHPDVWIAPSYCGQELRALGVTASEYLPALQYAPAAQFTLGLAREGVLRGASARHRLRSGDFYVTDSDYGSYVLIRPRLSTGNESLAGGSLLCERVPADLVEYTIVPPGLLDLWAQLIAELGWVWPQQVGTGAYGASEFAFHAGASASEAAATATCATPTYCSAVIAGESRSTSGSLYTTVLAVEELAR